MVIAILKLEKVFYSLVRLIKQYERHPFIGEHTYGNFDLGRSLEPVSAFLVGIISWRNCRANCDVCSHLITNNNASGCHVTNEYRCSATSTWRHTPPRHLLIINHRLRGEAGGGCRAPMPHCFVRSRDMSIRESWTRYWDHPTDLTFTGFIYTGWFK